MSEGESLEPLALNSELSLVPSVFSVPPWLCFPAFGIRPRVGTLAVRDYGRR